MKKKILGAVLSLGAIVGLASCAEEPHQHEFSKEWSSNAGGHWHACECDDRIHDSFAAHVDANKDGKCDVCTFAVEVPAEPKEEHKHSYAEAWTSNAVGHWHACECDTNVMGSFAAHVDADDNAKCDVCDAAVEKHTHTYATEWSKNDSEHWHESTCDHKTTSDKAAHTIGEDGKCTVCGHGGEDVNVATLKAIEVAAGDSKLSYLIGDELSTAGVVVYETYDNTLYDDSYKLVEDLTDYTVTIKDAKGNVVEGAFASHGTHTVIISSGSIEDSYEVVVVETVYESVSDAYAVGMENNDNIASGSISIDIEGSDSIQNYEFAFGDNYTLIKEGEDEKHYQLLEDGTALLIEITKYDDETYFYAYHDQEPAEMNGVKFTALFNYDDVIGTSELLEKLVKMSKSENASNYKEVLGSMCSCGECSTHAAYKFSFDYKYDDADNTYEVAFTLDDVTKTINKIEIKVTSTYDGYNYETDEYGTMTTVTYASIEQTAGDKDEENPYKFEELTFESFDLVDTTEEKVENNHEFKITVGEYIYLYLENVTPSTALASVDRIEITVTTEDGQPTYSANGSYDSWENNIYLYSYKPGKYNVEIKSANVTYNYVLNVSYADLEDFYAVVWDDNNYGYMETDTITVYKNQVVDFMAEVNQNANGAYTAAFSKDYETASIEESYENNYLFTASETGVYEITLTSAVDSSITATLQITVIEKPSVADILKGTYKYSSYTLGTVTYEFTPASEGATNGDLHIINAGSSMLPDGEGFFTYEYSNDQLTLTPANPGSSRNLFSFEVNDKLQIVCVYNTYPQGVCEKVEEKAEDEEKSSPLIGTFTAVVPHPMSGQEQNYIITFDEDGIGSYNFQAGYQTGTFTYTFEDGVVTFTSIDADGTIVGMTASIEGDVLTITYTFEIGENETDSSNVPFTVEGLGEATPSGAIEIEASQWGVPYNYTADKAGNYTFTVAEGDGSLIYDFGDPCQTFTVYLSAGQTIEIGVLDKDDNGLVYLSVAYEEASIPTSDFETAISQSWICELDGIVYFMSFDEETFTLASRFMGEMSLATYSYSHDGSGNISFEFVEGDENPIYSMYGPYGTVKFDETFTRLTINDWNFVIYE